MFSHNVLIGYNLRKFHRKQSSFSVIANVDFTRPDYKANTCIVVRMFFRHNLSHAQALILLVNDMHKRAISAPAAESFYGSGNAKGNFLY